MNVALLVIDVVLAVAVVYLLIVQRRRGPEFEEAITENVLKDAVTQLYNRRHLLQRLQDNMARCERDKKSLAVVLWDVAGFPEFVNDHGKTEGEKLLRQVAGSLRKSVRAYDELFRSGENEFCAVLVPSDKDVATEVTRRVNELVAKEVFTGDSEFSRHQFSLSSGFVFYPGEAQTVDSLLYAARQELYKTKLTQTSLN